MNFSVCVLYDDDDDYYYYYYWSGLVLDREVDPALASSPGPTFILKLRERKIGPGRHCQGPSAHALACTKKTW